MSDWRHILSTGRLICREKAPYFASILMGLVTTETPGLGTIGVTEHGHLLVDPEFLVQVTPEECAGLLAHEILHVMFEHVTHARQAGRDVRVIGVAQDLAINPAVVDMQFRLPGGDNAGVFPESQTFPAKDGFKRGLTADEYYNLLMKKIEQEQQAAKGKKSGQGAGKGSSGAGGEGEPDESNDEHGEGGQGGDDDHDHDGEGPTSKALPKKPATGKGWCGSCAAREMPKEPGKDPSTGARGEQEIERMIRQAAEEIQQAAAKGRGTVPAGLKRWADDLLKPAEIPWETKLARAFRGACAHTAGAADHKYDGPSRRQAGLGYGMGRPILPRLRLPIPLVDVIGDTSGSMGRPELGHVVSETNGILKATGANVRFCACDCRNNGITKLKSAEDLVRALAGGGGTDMRPAFDAMMKQTPRPQIIVCITDGLVGNGFPKEPIPGVKVIIVLVGGHMQKIPGTDWAETIVIPPGAPLKDEAPLNVFAP